MGKVPVPAGKTAQPASGFGSPDVTPAKVSKDYEVEEIETDDGKVRMPLPESSYISVP